MRRVIGIMTIVLLVISAMPAIAATPEVVLDEPGVNEGSSAASDGYLVWSASSDERPGHSNSYVKADGGDAVRLNPVGTHSFSVTIDGTTVVYQQGASVGDGFDDDFRFFDAVTLNRSNAPRGVNSRFIESRPSLSGDHLLFTRTNANKVRFRAAWTKVVLFDLVTETETVLATLPTRSSYLVSDQVKGDWATYESCDFDPSKGFFDCNVFRYQISTEDLVELPNPGLQQYAGALSSDGTVFLTRTRERDRWVCGNRARIVRVPVAGETTVIATLPLGRDALTSFALDESDGSTTLFIDRLRCRNGASGIYRIADADTTS